MHRQPFEGFVKGEGVKIPVEVFAVEVNAKALRQLIRRRVDVALGRVLGGSEFALTQNTAQMEITG